MPVQPTHISARRASGHSPVLSQTRLLSALATLADALAPGQVLNVPAVLDRASLLVCLSVLTTNAPAPTTVPAPGCAIAPPRLNLAGYCRVCLVHDCRDAECEQSWSRLRWRACYTCHGSGYADIDAGPDNVTTLCGDCRSLGVVEFLAQDTEVWYVTAPERRLVLVIDECPELW